MKRYQFVFSIKPRPQPWAPGMAVIGAFSGAPLILPCEPFTEASQKMVREADLCIYKAMAHPLN
ncbi:hypothetical protein BcepF1.015 [Burkholderia phage BcepF1]|uniref:Uncharacterized protein n=1 Tax=Burkholderia phage BcepF1 TaxID=2886897 RepID=A1YZR9_9CAUD|nr:hypothetical protein BcepF1.015 [Burkholderia phage BcepF1]ABL96746.1 hypothetical protein BcepF1.015 [Burkholderia phage BcepF1]